MQFVLLIYQPPGFDPKALSPETHRRVAAGYAEVTGTAGVASGPPMGFAASARTVRVRDGASEIAEGPYAGADAAIGGYLTLEADSLDEALALAAKVPAARLGGAVEVRPCGVYW